MFPLCKCEATNFFKYHTVKITKRDLCVEIKSKERRYLSGVSDVQMSFTLPDAAGIKLTDAADAERNAVIFCVLTTTTTTEID